MGSPVPPSFTCEDDSRWLAPCETASASPFADVAATHQGAGRQRALSHSFGQRRQGMSACSAAMAAALEDVSYTSSGAAVALARVVLQEASNGKRLIRHGNGL